MSDHKLCRYCGQPVKPKGIRNLPNEYDHARGCPYAPKKKARIPAPDRAAGSDKNTEERR